METKYYDHKKNELKDKKILEALARAARDYENGAILEARDELADIVNAIDEFDAHN